MIFRTTLFFSMLILLNSCGVTKPDQAPLTTNQDEAFYWSENKQFIVQAVWEQQAVAGLKAINDNILQLTFFSLDRTPARDVRLNADQVRPFMPSMGHGSENFHVVEQEQENQVTISNLHFNMPSMGNHGWVIYVEFTVNGIEDRVTIPVQVNDFQSSSLKSGKSTEEFNPSNSKKAALTATTLPSANTMWFVRAAYSSPLKARQLTGNQVTLTFFDRDGQPAKSLQLTKEDIEPWMYMPSAEHGNFGQDQHVILDTEQTNQLVVRNLFFVMASHMTSPSGQQKKMGQWVLKIKAEVNGKQDTIEMPVPEVI